MLNKTKPVEVQTDGISGICSTEHRLPFDLDTALRGTTPVITRSGRVMQNLHYTDDPANQWPIAVSIDGHWRTFDRQGHESDSNSEYDLFLAIPQTTIYGALYKRRDGTLHPCIYYVEGYRQSQIAELVSTGWKLLKTFELEVET